MRDGTQIPELNRIVQKDGRSVDEQYQFQETNLLSTEWFPTRGADRKPMKVFKEIMDARVANLTWVAETRERLSSLGWFMKCLKEPLARLANKQDE